MSTAAIAATPQMGFRMRTVDLHSQGLLGQLGLCVLPAMAAVFVAHPLLGAQYTLGSLLAVLGYHVVRRDRFAFGCIVLGSLPVLNLMRGLFFYYGIIALFGGCCLMWMALSPERLVHLWRDQAWRWMTVGLFVFWWISMLLTGSYASNLRSFEVILSSACVVLVAERRSYLATGLVGMAMSAAALGFGLLPYGDRLGQGVVGETSIGNPILLGMPCAFLVVISLADSGRWMLAERRIFLRILICLTMAELLILSGSRGSWIASLTGLTALVLFSRKDRKTLMIALVFVAAVAMLWLSTNRGQKIATQFEKTVDSDRSFANRTSGRSVQWSVIPKVFAESPIWGWGPGSGKDVAAIYTGRHLGWHALYLQMIGETGLIGTSLLLVFLGSLVLRGFRHWKRSQEIAPLASILTYLVVGASVSGLDAISGVFIGLALLGGDAVPRMVLAQARLVPLEGCMSVVSALPSMAQSLVCWCRGGNWESQFRTKKFGLLRCSGCGGYQIDPPPLQTPESSEEFYTEYYSRASVNHLVAQAKQEKSAYWSVLDQVSYLPLKGNRAADVGCGDGHLCSQLREAGWRSVVGADVSRVRIARAQAMYPQDHFIAGTLDDGNCERNSIDLMVMDSVVEHLVNPEEILIGLRKYLSPDGYFVALTPNMDSGHFAFLQKRWTGMLAPHTHIFLFTADALRKLLQRAGFSVVATGSIHDQPYRPSQFLRRLGSGDVKGAIWRAHQEIGGWYGRMIGQGPILYAVARKGH